MGAVAEAKDRLVKHREDVRHKNELKEQERFQSMRADVLELWGAMRETHEMGLHLKYAELHEYLPNELSDFLFSESDKRDQSGMNFVLYPTKDGDISKLVLAMVDENNPVGSEQYCIAGMALSVRGELITLEPYTMRGVHTDTAARQDKLLSHITEGGLFLRYGEAIVRLAQHKYIDAVNVESGDPQASMV